MRILFASQMVPYPEHGVRGGHAIVYSIIREMARRNGVDVGLLVARDPAAGPFDDQERRGLDAMRADGVTVLEPVMMEPAASPPGPTSLANFTLETFYPLIGNRAALHRAADAFRPDVILPIAAELMAVAFSDYPAIRFVFYGNPDPKVRRAHARRMREFGAPEEQYRIQMAVADRLETFHLDVMRRYHGLVDVAANDAAYYTEKGHPNASYIQNMWLDFFDGRWEERRKGQEVPGKIIASVGKLNSTANTMALEYLGRELLPELRRALNGVPYELHVLGPDQPPYQPQPTVDAILRQPEFRRRGFIEDIDAEILSSPVFLSTTSASEFKVGHSRYLHAWSLGGCVVAHRDSAIAMPEIVHNENALLGGSAAEIADLTALALRDPELRLRIGRNGYRTLMSVFTPCRVVDVMLARLASLAEAAPLVDRVAAQGASDSDGAAPAPLPAFDGVATADPGTLETGGWSPFLLNRLYARYGAELPGLAGREAELLYMLVREIRPAHVLQAGTLPFDEPRYAAAIEAALARNGAGRRSSRRGLGDGTETAPIEPMDILVIDNIDRIPFALRALDELTPRAGLCFVGGVAETTTQPGALRPVGAFSGNSGPLHLLQALHLNGRRLLSVAEAAGRVDGAPPRSGEPETAIVFRGHEMTAAARALNACRRETLQWAHRAVDGERAGVLADIAALNPDAPIHAHLTALESLRSLGVRWPAPAGAPNLIDTLRRAYADIGRLSAAEHVAALETTTGLHAPAELILQLTRSARRSRIARPFLIAAEEAYRNRVAARLTTAALDAS